MDRIISTIIPDRHGRKEFHTPHVKICHRLCFTEHKEILERDVPYRDECQVYIEDAAGHRFICTSDAPIAIHRLDNDTTEKAPSVLGFLDSCWDIVKDVVTAPKVCQT